MDKKCENLGYEELVRKIRELNPVEYRCSRHFITGYGWCVLSFVHPSALRYPEGYKWDATTKTITNKEQAADEIGESYMAFTLEIDDEKDEKERVKNLGYEALIRQIQELNPVEYRCSRHYFEGYGWCVLSFVHPSILRYPEGYRWDSASKTITNKVFATDEIGESYRAFTLENEVRKDCPADEIV